MKKYFFVQLLTLCTFLTGISSVYATSEEPLEYKYKDSKDLNSADWERLFGFKMLSLPHHLRKKGWSEWLVPLSLKKASVYFKQMVENHLKDTVNFFSENQRKYLDLDYVEMHSIYGLVDDEGVLIGLVGEIGYSLQLGDSVDNYDGCSLVVLKPINNADSALFRHLIRECY